MAERPTSITAIAALFVAVGVAGIVQPLFSRGQHQPSSAEYFWVLALNSLAVLCGILLLKRRAWARWISLAWIAAHIGISFLNSIEEAAVHALFLALIAYVLFRRKANFWFHKSANCKLTI